MNTVCTACQAINRVPDERAGDAAKCGRCGHALFDGKVTNATSATLDALLKDSLPVVVDFWAPWCGPCHNFAPVFEEVAEERSGQLRFVKVNTEAEPELSARFRIRSIPSIMIFKEGKLVDMLSGAMPKTPFEEWLDENL
ncbi:thioredoxin TrxC [Enterobacteriaceae bacterium BIT-l23]|uniref:Thioredoxin n=1 Tax=Jejubacter calystegiae TaxID=2579935 RepID=A0A4P8YNK1_9ENTR|nr:thioredoxin TrxC [Jejubacter calystegiae]NUU68811.1 thioredoxin TrxC [Enterobacteriaceae bacterium BIT-l23]QCT22455.1 thioredoxin TrxC [Jejubacter calystegiae]